MGQCCSFLKNNYGIIIVLIILIFLLNFRYNYVKEKRDKIGKNNQNSNY